MLFSDSADAGLARSLPDVLGSPVRGWDARGHTLRYLYDALRRPTHLFVRAKHGSEVLAGRSVYGEAHPEAVARNLRTQGVPALRRRRRGDERALRLRRQPRRREPAARSAATARRPTGRAIAELDGRRRDRGGRGRAARTRDLRHDRRLRCPRARRLARHARPERDAALVRRGEPAPARGRARSRCSGADDLRRGHRVQRARGPHAHRARERRRDVLRVRSQRPSGWRIS